MARIWEDVLGVPRVGAEDDFFDLGGQSLRAAQVMFRIRQTLGAVLPLRRIFEAPRLEALAREVAELLRNAKISQTEVNPLADYEIEEVADGFIRKSKPKFWTPPQDRQPLAEDSEVVDLLEALFREKARAVSRRTVIRFPARCFLETPSMLYFQLIVTSSVDPLLQRLTMLPAMRSASTETLTIQVTAPTFQVTPRLARTEVPVVENSQDVVFKLVPREPGLQLIELEVFAGAERVGYFTLECEVVEHVH